VTDKSFDQLTKLVSSSTSRRGLLKGAAAAALSGVAMRLRGGSDAAARARVRMACARLGQPCDTVVGTPGNMICCPGLACDMNGETLSCCKPENESCVENTDCCAGNVCRPNPTGLGNRCLPPGDVGAECIEDADCASGLCDGYSGTCLDNGCGMGCFGGPYIGPPTFCGADSRSNAPCACYPTTEDTCSCSASNGCPDVSGGCSSSADCPIGRTCIIPLGVPNISGFGPVGVCGANCDFLGDIYGVGPFSTESAFAW
jgi:hypothetical protein